MVVRVNSVVDRFPEGKMKQKTDVWSLSCQGLEGGVHPGQERTCD